MKQKAHRWNVIMGTVVFLALLIAGIWWLKGPSHKVLKIGSYTITQDHLALYENDCRSKD